MENKKRYILLAITIILIVLAISYLDNKHSSLSSKIENFSSIIDKEGKYSHAIEISGGTGYINSKDNLSLSPFIGNKVILIDFWTYSCINCIRTIPYLSYWNDKYKDYGLEIIGVHTPEFSFEKEYSNVLMAVKRLGINYSIVLDSNYVIWNAYHNQYWPAEYLIDSDGYIRETHFGEGNYNETENNIRQLLEERAKKLNLSINMNFSIPDKIDYIPIDFSSVRSPETYFGSNRNEYLANGIVGSEGVQNLSLPDKLQFNQLYLEGLWNITREYASPLSKDSKIVYGYSSKNVYLVASSIENRTISINIDGKINGNVSLGPYNLYNIISGENYGVHGLEISNLTKDIKFYTFTFG